MCIVSNEKPALVLDLPLNPCLQGDQVIPVVHLVLSAQLARPSQDYHGYLEHPGCPECRECRGCRELRQKRCIHCTRNTIHWAVEINWY